ncbi:MAG: HAD family hydrolase [Armatimonadota bacterium]
MRSASVLIIFDFDNTLIDSRIDFMALRTALIDHLATAGPLPAAREAMMRFPILHLVEQAATRSPDLRRAMWVTIEAYEAEGLKNAPAMPHANTVLASLAARGYRLALLTNNARAATIRVLDEHGLAALFGLTVTRDDVPALKPDPSGVRFILDRLGPTPAAYLVGDSWIDGQAAQQGGIRFVGFGPRRTEVETRGVTPWAWITDLRELLDLDWDA